MDENNNRTSDPLTEYRPAPGFSAFQHMEAVLGISDALERLLNEGPGTDRV